MAGLILDVVTPQKSTVESVEVEKVMLSGELGEFMVLPNHKSLLTNLKSGTFAYFKDNFWNWAVLSGGFAQIKDNKVLVLAETIELQNKIDAARAKQALERAEKRLKNWSEDGTDSDRAMAAKARADARLDTATRK